MASLPTLSDGIALTHFIVAEDVERAVRFYSDVLGGEIVLAGQPTIVALANGWIIIDAVAFQLPSGGVNVIVHGRDAGRGDTVAREITHEGRSARLVAADLLDKREVARPMDEAADVEWLITATDSAREPDDHVLGLRPNGGHPDALWVSAQALKSAP